MSTYDPAAIDSPPQFTDGVNVVSANFLNAIPLHFADVHDACDALVSGSIALVGPPPGGPMAFDATNDLIGDSTFTGIPVSMDYGSEYVAVATVNAAGTSDRLLIFDRTNISGGSLSLSLTETPGVAGAAVAMTDDYVVVARGDILECFEIGGAWAQQWVYDHGARVDVVDVDQTYAYLAGAAGTSSANVRSITLATGAQNWAKVLGSSSADGIVSNGDTVWLALNNFDNFGGYKCSTGVSSTYARSKVDSLYPVFAGKFLYLENQGIWCVGQESDDTVSSPQVSCITGSEGAQPRLAIPGSSLNAGEATSSYAMDGTFFAGNQGTSMSLFSRATASLVNTISTAAVAAIMGGACATITSIMLDEYALYIGYDVNSTGAGGLAVWELQHPLRHMMRNEPASDTGARIRRPMVRLDEQRGVEPPVHAHLAIENGSTGISVGTSPVVVTGLDVKSNHGFEIASSVVTPRAPGRYRVMCQCSFEGTNGSSFVLELYSAGVATGIRFSRPADNAAPAGSASFMGIVDALSTYDLDLRVVSSSPSDTFTPVELQLIIERIDQQVFVS